MDSSRPVAIAFGAHITALAVLRAFGRARIPVYSAGRNRLSIARSRWYRPVPGEEIDDVAGADRLASWLGGMPFERSVLFPCSDRWVVALAAISDRDVARVHVPAVAPADVVRVLVDKQVFARAAAAHGVAAPRVLQPAEIGSLDSSELQYFFIKPRNSQAFSDRFGVKALKPNTRAEAMDLLGELESEGVEVLLQEFIPGPPTAHVFLDGYVDRSGVMRACLARRRLRMYPRPFGNSTLTVTIPMSEVAEAVASLRRLFERLGYFGLFDAEFKQDARDGRFKILEVNARPWWQLELAEACGLGVCMLAYRDAQGEPLSTVSSYLIGHTWVHPVPDLTAWWADRKHDDRAGGFPVRSWFTGPNTVFSWDDPKPAIEEISRFVRLAFLRKKKPLPAPAPVSEVSDRAASA